MTRLFALLTLLSGCTTWHPVDLYPMSKPLEPGYVEGERRKSSDCNVVILSWLRFGNGAKMSGLLQDVKGDADAVVEMTVDYRLSNYLIFGTECYTMWGVPVYTDGRQPPEKHEKKGHEE